MSVMPLIHTPSSRCYNQRGLHRDPTAISRPSGMLADAHNALKMCDVVSLPSKENSKFPSSGPSAGQSWQCVQAAPPLCHWCPYRLHVRVHCVQGPCTAIVSGVHDPYSLQGAR
eukprot:scpid81952/ scgid24570/ 